MLSISHVLSNLTLAINISLKQYDEKMPFTGGDTELRWSQWTRFTEFARGNAAMIIQIS